MGATTSPGGRGPGPGTTAAGGGALGFDETGRASLDGPWELHPGDSGPAGLDGRAPATVSVPGLWEAQGHLDLDGVAWYRRRFVLDDAAGFWTLRFGAVMDRADVYLNGRHLGSHDGPFTPFELDPAGALVAGANDLAVRVVDPPAGDPEHRRMPHGKQGWAGAVFPSPPSLYLTYGGIWQPVTLRRHGPVVVTDVFVQADPDDLVVTVEVENRTAEPCRARVAVRAAGRAADPAVEVGPGRVAVVEARLGPTPARRWSPAEPVLHHCVVEAHAGGAPSDVRTVRFGLRAVRVEGHRLTVGGEPYRMRAALVQGFRPDSLYAEGTRAQIEEEVRAARAMGFDTLRLHVKAFDPTYLDVCDELGMLVHCDLPVAEPVAPEEVGAGTELARRCAAAGREQVRRDRNHPSVVLWSAMNEIGVEDAGVRASPGYADFARVLVDAVREADPTRPVVENDWVDPDPDRAPHGDVLTAHWYGRLDAAHLERLAASCRRWEGLGRPLLVTEFGDWGLPGPPPPGAGPTPFWDTWAATAAAVAAAGWPGSPAAFAAGTQRHQGLSDRLQGEVLRRHDSVGGYGVTELTDVPLELNGLLDLHRRPKPPAAAELARLNQPVLPMLRMAGLVAVAGGELRAGVHVANDGPPLSAVEVEAWFGAGRTDDGPPAVVAAGRLPGWRASELGEVAVEVPEVPGTSDLVVTLRAGGRVVASNRYPVHVVAPPSAPLAVQVLGGPPAGAALAAVGARVGGDGPLFVGEGDLDQAAGAHVRARLAAGATAVVLAQPPPAAAHYPVPAGLVALEAAWGPSTFRFTTGGGALASLPRRAVLAAEDATVAPDAVLTGPAGGPLATHAEVAALRPAPAPLAATVVGALAVGAGRLVVCQYRLVAGALDGDPAARALLADLVHWAAAPRPPMAVEVVTRDDGRRLAYHSFPPGWDG